LGLIDIFLFNIFKSGIAEEYLRFALYCAILWLQKENIDMTENSVVRARIDAATKAEASAVLASIGLSLSDAVRLMLKRVVAEKALPFEPLIPNAETIEAIKAARRGELTTASSLDGLFQGLNADD
ncbi:MAG: type II toxin-antitoxin system RelB/DinJ family antitoxin, partial [Chlorobium sp.]